MTCPFAPYLTVLIGWYLFHQVSVFQGRRGSHCPRLLRKHGHPFEYIVEQVCMHPPSHLPTPHLLVTARMGSNRQQSALTSVGIAIVIWFAITYTLSVFQWRARRRGLPFPPGPSSLLPVGNILHMRKSEPWRAHHALCKTYGRSVCTSLRGGF